ncbi:SRPBCC family protein [Desertihabitans aurantiacus]|uniref:SRPBCC family protein n=1 Tax=Desertihabitans aurantiacus TaxID=2282477 RepID=UPI000DF79CCF
MPSRAHVPPRPRPPCSGGARPGPPPRWVARDRGLGGRATAVPPAGLHRRATRHRHGRLRGGDPRRPRRRPAGGGVGVDQRPVATAGRPRALRGLPGRRRHPGAGRGVGAGLPGRRPPAGRVRRRPLPGRGGARRRPRHLPVRGVGLHQPQRLAVEHGVAEFRFLPEAGGTRLRWRYAFRPTSPLTAPLVEAFLRSTMSPMMTASLEAVRAGVEAG